MKKQNVVNTAIGATIGLVFTLIVASQHEQPRLAEAYSENNTTASIEPVTIEIVAQPTTEEETKEQTTEELTAELVNLGVFKLTAYCPCKKCSGQWGTQTSTGATATQGRTIAVDPNIIPYGTAVVINGQEYIAEDCGGAVDGKHIDIFFNSHKEALKFGVQYAEVYESR